MTGDKILPIHAHELQQKLIQKNLERIRDEEDEEDDNTHDCCPIISCVYLCCLLVVMMIITIQSDNN